MKFYSFGDQNKPVIMLFPGTCMHWKNNFGHVIEGLQSDFYVVCVSYDGFDETEDTVFTSMREETRKIESYIRENFDGKIKAAYGCSLGGSFVSLLIQRKNIHIEHGIIGSSDMDQMPKLPASVLTKLFMPMFYQMLHTGSLSKKMKQKMESAGEDDAEVKMMKMMKIGDGGMPFIKKESMENQFCTDLYTKVDDNISVEGTKIHVFYAKKMEKEGETKYLDRYRKHFKDPDIIPFDMKHEELLICYPDQWVKEVIRAVES